MFIGLIYHANKRAASRAKYVSMKSAPARRIEVSVGETVERDGFAYADLLPA